MNIDMDLIKKVWPTPFNVKEKDVVSLVIQLVIFLVVCAIAGIIIGLLAGIPIIGFLFSIIGSAMGIYSLIGIGLCVLKFLGKC
jgi:predicted Co/Zn/Cd cation transporter (cation efflux family)